MALWVCDDCTARYSVGAPKCPQCGGTEHTEEGQETMPKTTVHGGPSIADTEVVAVSEHRVEVDPAPTETHEEEPREDTAPETSSEAPAEQPEPETAEPAQDEPATLRRSRRRTTE